ncbi:DUF4886 domain-containing protein [Sphingobacterium rhinopitheci]|uniref:DUF4886 domain-containing protein n=1 Tax=Sphingobacterium rhinopitheci TaxID=2781960 RepID=UPI001F528E5A|nr:DUF4886 domain-containing protein [Sphingobacterium rhinopitheci]MCI0920302.1 DUF4886 domain-containing protein [Sphingobacterium rhinopitheci]
MRSTICTILFGILLSIPTYGQEKIIKILAIGNSFSEDAIENYLFELAKEADKKVIIGNMYIGGASIELHVKNATENKPTYSYRKVTTDGVKTNTKNSSIEQVIKEEDWDYISLQQASPYSGQYAVIIKDLPALVTYVNMLKPKKTKLIYHQTWAYQQDSPHKGFANYNNNQLEMYQGIIAATQKINKSKVFSMVIPAGTAIQNARTSSIGDHYTRDGYHLNLDYGRFTAACTWYEKIFNLDVRKNNYKPDQVTELQANIAKDAAHKAVKNPWKITTVKL